MTPSYALSKKHGRWIAAGKLPGAKRPFEIDCGKATVTREAADAVAAIKYKSKVDGARGAKVRMEKFHAKRAAEAASTPPVTPAAIAPGHTAEQLGGSAPPLDRNVEIAARIRAIKPEPITPDAVIPPVRDDEPDPDLGDDDDEELEARARDEEEPKDDGNADDGEAQELLSDAIATVLVTATIKAANAPLKRAKPPQRGEPDERFRDMGHAGLKKTFEKLIGANMRLSPGMQILVGLGGTVVTIWMNAEPISAADASGPSAGHTSAPAPPSSAGHTNGAGAAGHTAPVPPAPAAQSLALSVGTFGVEKTERGN